MGMTRGDHDLLAGLPAGLATANGVPPAHAVAGRLRAAELAAGALAASLYPGGLRTSPLGPSWSRDLDAHVHRWPADDDLRARGWLPLDDLLRRVGSPGRGRWAVVEDGAVLAALDLHAGPPPDPVAAVLRRCRERGQVRLREVLELRILQRAGHRLPATDPALRAAAGIEAALGGDELRRWAGRARPLPPVALRAPAGASLRRWAGSHLRPRLVVACSGVDGAGKTTLCDRLRRDLEQAGVPVTVVWTRPGMGPAWLSGLARAAKRALGHDPEPGVRSVARGTGPPPPSRSGALGWAWAMVVTAAFVGDVRRQWRQARGVLIFDRHLVDALATLDFVYAGPPLGLARRWVAGALPRAALSFYLDVPPEVAVARKPGDTFGDHAVRRQLELYRERLACVPGLQVLDATRPPEEMARIVLGALAGDRARTAGLLVGAAR